MCNFKSGLIKPFGLIISLSSCEYQDPQTLYVQGTAKYVWVRDKNKFKTWVLSLWSLQPLWEMQKYKFQGEMVPILGMI